MKNKLFENIGGNSFKLRNEYDYDDMDTKGLIDMGFKDSAIDDIHRYFRKAYLSKQEVIDVDNINIDFGDNPYVDRLSDDEYNKLLEEISFVYGYIYDQTIGKNGAYISNEIYYG